MHHHMKRFSAAVLTILLALNACAHPRQQGLQGQFEKGLAAQASATEALRLWCDTRGLAKPAQIIAEIVPGRQFAPPEDIHNLLDVPVSEPLGYRHVKLICGDRVLSQAHNWYVPSRLTAEMNRQLAETDTPFGRVVSSLGFKRRGIASTRQRDPACPKGTILANRAILTLPDGRGLAMVVECYTDVNLR